MYVLVANNLHMSPYKQSCWDHKKGNVYTTPTIDSLYPIKKICIYSFLGSNVALEQFDDQGEMSVLLNISPYAARLYFGVVQINGMPHSIRLVKN